MGNRQRKEERPRGRVFVVDKVRYGKGSWSQTGAGMRGGWLQKGYTDIRWSERKLGIVNPDWGEGSRVQKRAEKGRQSTHE